MAADRACSHRQAGFTLVELLVVVVILGIVGAIVTNSVVTASRATARGQARVEALSDLQRGMERITRELRAADPLILDPTFDFSNRMSAQVRRGDERRVYTYYLVEDGESRVLREDVRTYDLATGDPTGEANGLFIVDVDNSADDPLFRYFDANGDEIDCGPPFATVAEESACLSAHATALLVELRLIKTLPDQDPIELSAVVNIRNTRYTD